VLKVPNAALRFRPPGANDAKPAADAPAAPASGSQALQQFRQRLTEEVKPDPAQQAQIDASFADLRQKFAALREVADEAERRRSGERLRADLRTRIAELLRPEQKGAYQRVLREFGARGAASAGRAWVLESGAPQPVEVRLGLSDGTSTELIGDTLAEGAEVIVGLAAGADKRESGLPRLRLF